MVQGSVLQPRHSASTSPCNAEVAWYQSSHQWMFIFQYISDVKDIGFLIFHHPPSSTYPYPIISPSASFTMPPRRMITSGFRVSQPQRAMTPPGKMRAVAPRSSSNLLPNQDEALCMSAANRPHSTQMQQIGRCHWAANLLIFHV